MYRTTALIDAPASVVAAALLETATLRAAGLALRADAELLIPGHEFRLGRGKVRVVDAKRHRVSMVALAGPPRELAVDLAETPAGTLLTATVEGRVRRSRALALIEGIAEQAQHRAQELRGATIVVATAIIRDNEVLAQQRSYPVEAAGRWEFPGGRVEPGESEMDAVERECAEELGVTVEAGDVLGPDVVLAGGKYLLRTYRATLVDGEPQAREHLAVRWLTGGRLGEVDWLPADRVLLPELRTLL